MWTSEQIEAAKDAKAFAVDNEVMALIESGIGKHMSADERYNLGLLNAITNVRYYAEEYGIDRELLLEVMNGYV